MKSTVLYETWLDGGILSAELVESTDSEPTVLVQSIDGRDASVVKGQITLHDLLRVPMNQPVAVEMFGAAGDAGEIKLPYRVVDKALSFLGYEEM